MEAHSLALAPIADPRYPYRHLADPRLDRTLWQVAVAHHPPPAAGILLSVELLEKIAELDLDRLLKELSSSLAKHFRQGVLYSLFLW